MPERPRLFHWSLNCTVDCSLLLEEQKKIGPALLCACLGNTIKLVKPMSVYTVIELNCWLLGAMLNLGRYAGLRGGAVCLALFLHFLRFYRCESSMSFCFYAGDTDWK